MPKRRELPPLTRRERQVMDILYRRGEATVSEILDDLPDPPGYSSVRSIVRILSDKGLVTHRADGVRYVYAPAETPEAAQEKALEHVVSTYFAGSPEQAVTALLRMSDSKLTPAAVKRLRDAIGRAKSDER